MLALYYSTKFYGLMSRSSQDMLKNVASCINTHHDVTELEVPGMVGNTEIGFFKDRT